MRIDIYIAVNHLYINLSNDSTLKLLLTENLGHAKARNASLRTLLRLIDVVMVFS